MVSPRMADPPSRATDLTAILVREGEHDPGSVSRVVAAGGLGGVWLRVQPLAPLGLLQVEVCGGDGLPNATPAMVQALSRDKRRAVFVHVNHQASQAMVHGFADGQALSLAAGEAPGGWLGAPDGLDGKLAAALGRPVTLEALIAAD